MIIYSHYFNAFKSSIRHPFLFTARSQGDPYSDALSGDSRDFTSASKSFFPVVEERLRNVAAYKPRFTMDIPAGTAGMANDEVG